MCATMRGQFQGQRQTEEEAGTTLGAGTTKVPGFTSHFSTQGPHFFPPEPKISGAMPSVCPGSWRVSRSSRYARTLNWSTKGGAHSSTRQGQPQATSPGSLSAAKSGFRSVSMGRLLHEPRRDMVLGPS